jgi:hypothetical protein
MIIGAVLGSTTLILVSGLNKDLGISDHTFMVSDSVVLTVLGQVKKIWAWPECHSLYTRMPRIHPSNLPQVSFMPILVLAARLCPEGVEATLFATLMSVLNGGASLGATLGAGLTASLGVTSDK